MNDLKSRRGNIIISREVINRVLDGDADPTREWALIFADFVVLHVEQDWRWGSVTYHGYHPGFQIVAQCSPATNYDVIAHRSSFEQVQPSTVEFVPRNSSP